MCECVEVKRRENRIARLEKVLKSALPVLREYGGREWSTTKARRLMEEAEAVLEGDYFYEIGR